MNYDQKKTFLSADTQKCTIPSERVTRAFPISASHMVLCNASNRQRPTRDILNRESDHNGLSAHTCMP